MEERIRQEMGQGKEEKVNPKPIWPRQIVSLIFPLIVNIFFQKSNVSDPPDFRDKLMTELSSDTKKWTIHHRLWENCWTILNPIEINLYLKDMNQFPDWFKIVEFSEQETGRI